MGDTTELQEAFAKLKKSIEKQWGDVWPAEIADELSALDALINPPADVPPAETESVG
jgi:hypothetical protein